MALHKIELHKLRELMKAERQPTLNKGRIGDSVHVNVEMLTSTTLEDSNSKEPLFWFANQIALANKAAGLPKDCAFSTYVCVANGSGRDMPASYLPLEGSSLLFGEVPEGDKIIFATSKGVVKEPTVFVKKLTKAERDALAKEQQNN